MRHRITLLANFNGSQLWHAFEQADGVERDEILRSEILSLDMFQWPVTRFSKFLMGLDRVMPETEVTNKEMVLLEDDAGEIENAFLSATVWTSVDEYLKARALFKESLKGDPLSEAEFEAYDRASVSFHFPARVTIIENGVEVGTRESENMVCLRSHVDIVGHEMVTDLSDAHDDPEECARVAQFNAWFQEQLDRDSGPLLGS